MSWHEIEVRQRFDVKCLKCSWAEQRSSAGQAEEAAREHIEGDEDEPSEASRYGHRVVITESTLVGRQI